MNIKIAKAAVAVCLAAAAVSAILIVKYYAGAYREEKQVEGIRPVLQEWQAGGQKLPGDPYIGRWKKLYAKNKDFVAWLKVPGTKVDYPVMQRKGSPEYYLHRDFCGERSASGTPFLAGICDIEKPSDNLIIYGHHMRSGLMFASLTKFTDKNFYRKHHEIMLLTRDGLKRYAVHSVFTAQVYTGSNDEFRYYDKADFAGEADFGRFMDEVKDRRYYSTDAKASFGDKFITLSTCEYSSRDSRLAVFGVLKM
ncbi:MAG: class B sortase [Clostridiales Family XIII bacterium]|jgi:sortase B|nr:class B sortase [Clostridiales Family XIII bacterium]